MSLSFYSEVLFPNQRCCDTRHILETIIAGRASNRQAWTIQLQAATESCLCMPEASGQHSTLLAPGMQAEVNKTSMKSSRRQMWMKRWDKVLAVKSHFEALQAHLCARSTRSLVTHLPEIVLAAKGKDTLWRKHTQPVRIQW